MKEYKRPVAKNVKEVEKIEATLKKTGLIYDPCDSGITSKKIGFWRITKQEKESNG